jgi:hypothetical protein
MTDEALNDLTVEEKLKVTRYLIADLMERIMGEEADVAKRARHDIGALAMTFGNLRDLLANAAPDDLRIVQSIYNRYRYSASENTTNPQTS